MMKTLTIPEKKVSISSETESALSHARLPAGISIQECSVRSSFLLNKKTAVYTAVFCCRIPGIVIITN